MWLIFDFYSIIFLKENVIILKVIPNILYLIIQATVLKLNLLTIFRQLNDIDFLDIRILLLYLKFLSLKFDMI